MYKMIETKIIDVGPKLAEKYLECNTYAGQRPIREKRLSQLVKEMEEGTFRTGQIAITHLKYNDNQGNQKILVNGQHVSKAILIAGKMEKVNIEIFECYDPEDTALLFRKFDNGGTRSFQDMLRAESVALNIEWSPRISNLIASAASIKEGKQFSDKQEKTELLKKYLNFGKFLSNLFSVRERGTDISHLVRIPVVYPILMTFEKCQENSHKFWSSVRDGENLKTNMPEYKLFRYLTRVCVASGRGASSNHFRIASQHEIISKCIHAWNAFRRGDTTDLKYYSQSPIPKAI